MTIDQIIEQKIGQWQVVRGVELNHSQFLGLKKAFHEVVNELLK